MWNRWPSVSWASVSSAEPSGSFFWSFTTASCWCVGDGLSAKPP
jgi:hypothetical protein